MGSYLLLPSAAAQYILSICTVLGDTMARRKRSRSSQAAVARSSIHPLAELLRLSPIADLRTWHPDRYDRPVLNFDGNFSAVRIGTRRHHLAIHRRPVVARSRMMRLPVGLQLPVGVMFESPLRVTLCARRKMRREVMFALRKTRRGAGARSRKRNWRSSIAC